MNKRKWLFLIIVLGIIIANSCKKDENKTFTIPVLTTNNLSDIMSTSVTCGGIISSDGGSIVTTRGVCWNNIVDPTIENNKTTDNDSAGSFISKITGLIPNTKYFIRAYATNIIGTGYGMSISFTTNNGPLFNPNLTYGTATDIEGNNYKTITIGTQTWMAENLKTTKYNDGSSIPLVTDVISWDTITSPAYCWYMNEEVTYKATYGGYYNWYTVNTGKLSPTGWHVPTNAEWGILTDYLGGEEIAGGKIKETGLTRWMDPNTSATNETGFTALPGGSRNQFGIFSIYFGFYGFYWTSDNNGGWGQRVSYDLGDIHIGYYNKQNGYSVRCLKD